MARKKPLKNSEYQSTEQQEASPAEKPEKARPGRLESAMKSARNWVLDLIRRRTPAAEGTGAMTMPPPANVDTAFRLSGILVLASVLLVLLFGVVMGAKLYSVLGMGSNRITNIPIVYLQGRNTLKFMGPLVEHPVTVTDQLTFDSTGGYSIDQNTRLTANGKQLLYLNRISEGYGELYLRNSDREKVRGRGAESAGIRLDTGVWQDSFCFVLEDKAVLYMKTEHPEDRTAGKSLYLWEDGTERLLDTQVTQLLGESADHKVYYMTRPGAELSLSCLNLGEKGSKPVAIDEGLTGIIVEFDPASGSVVYSKQQDHPVNGDNPHDLYRWDGSKTRLQVADGAGALLDYGSKGEVFYLRMTSRKTDPMQYFEDDMAVVDGQMDEPQEKDFMVETKNIWGTKKIELDKKSLEAAQQEYAAKLNRDEIRKTIAAQARTQRTLELVYNTGTSETLVDTGILQVWDGSAKDGAAAYTKERIPTADPFLLSSVVDPVDAVRLINTVLINTVQDYYYAKVGNDPVLFLSATKNEQVKVLLDGATGFYYIKDDKKNLGGTLSYVSAQSEGLGVAKKVDDQVVRMTDIPNRGQLIYLRSEGSETATLCAVSGGVRTRLTEGVPRFPLPEAQGDVLLCYRDYDVGRQYGQLSLYSDRIKPVADQVQDYSFRLPGYIYLLKNYDAGLGWGDLYLYQGNSKKLKLIEKGVSDISA